MSCLANICAVNNVVLNAKALSYAQLSQCLTDL